MDASQDGGFGLSGAAYTTNNANPGITSSNLNNRSGATFKTANGSGSLSLNFASILTSAGGTINLLSFLPGSENAGFGLESRLVASGSVVSAVPLPGTLALFAAALLGLMGLRVRRSRRAAVSVHA